MLFYQCKVAYQTFGGENDKSGKGVYLLEALSYAEAEERITEELKPFMNGYFDKLDIKKVEVYELLENKQIEAYKWFKSKVVIVTYDEEKKKEKRTSVYFYVQAGDIKSALHALDKELSNSVVSTEIAMIQETPILDVFRLTAEMKEEAKEEK